MNKQSQPDFSGFFLLLKNISQIIYWTIFTATNHYGLQIGKIINNILAIILIMQHWFNQQIEKGKWMFFIYSSPLPIPLNFAVHTRIVTVSPAWETNRYEIHMFRNKKDRKQWYFYTNDRKPDQGMNIYPFTRSPSYQSKLLYKISWKSNSLAHKVVTFIDNNIKDYKYKNIYYHIPGPNCNTLTQRVLDQFPEIKIKLPWNAFGKRYKN